MKARITVNSFYWEIVEQKEVSVASYVLEEGGHFNLESRWDEKPGVTVVRIQPSSVRILLEGAPLVLLKNNISPAQGRPCPAFPLKVGTSVTVVTPTCDAGMIWKFTLEGVEQDRAGSSSVSI
jgi:hypothetical protein